MSDKFIKSKAAIAWGPKQPLSIEEIDVNMTDEMKDRNTAELKLSFTVGNQIETQEVTFTVEG